MALTILQVAFPFAPVGPDAVGGAEQVLSMVERCLPRFGHRAIVLACEGSVTSGPLLPVALPPGPVTDAMQDAVHAAMRARIAEALRRHPIDLVHMHGIDFHRYLPPSGVPVLATLHLPPGWYPPEIFRLARPDTWLHAVSASQHRACPPCPTLLPPVENGVAVGALDRPLTRRRFALVLGRICPEKNQHAALEAGTRAGLPVLLGGQVFPYAVHEAYWRGTVLPCLTRPHRFLGPLGFARKRRLLNAARCLVSASIAPETSFAGGDGSDGLRHARGRLRLRRAGRYRRARRHRLPGARRDGDGGGDAGRGRALPRHHPPHRPAALLGRGDARGLCGRLWSPRETRQQPCGLTLPSRQSRRRPTCRRWSGCARTGRHCGERCPARRPSSRRPG
ncbi:glycosyltransferase [Dankookia sp. P2]|uniref:glycosyltransferase n=1 Tax=Dankookia sp. P2 TaxID=3423955 RepID=UPI003D67FAC9